MYEIESIFLNHAVLLSSELLPFGPNTFMTWSLQFYWFHRKWIF